MVSKRKRIWGWYFFDWASQPYNTLLLTFVFGPYFAEIARGYYMGQGLSAEAASASAQSYWGWGLTVSSILIAFIAPILGSVADSTGRRMIWIWLFSAFYVVGAWALWWVAPGASDSSLLFWGVFFFGLGFIGMEFATIFTNALMPSLSEGDELGEVSGTGFAFGYLGGMIALLIVLGFLADDANTGLTMLGFELPFGLQAESREGARAVGPFTAIWYMIFMIPFFMWVKEPKTKSSPINIKAAVLQLRDLLASLRYRRSLSCYLGASLCYRDALNALYAFGGVYASGVLNWSLTEIGIFGIIGAVTAVIASWLGGKADRKYGPKPVVVGSIIVLIAVCSVIIGLTRESVWGIALDAASRQSDYIFFVCGALIGGAGGVIQAASRTLMVRHTTPEKATETFGLYALSGKVASFISPAMIAVVTALSGSQRIGMSPLILLFAVGLILLIWVNPKGETSR